MVHIVQPDTENPLGIAVQRGVDHLTAGHQTGHALQLRLAAVVIPAGHGGDFSGLDERHHVSLVGSTLGLVQRGDGQNALGSDDAGDFGVVVFDRSETHM